MRRVEIPAFAATAVLLGVFPVSVFLTGCARHASPAGDSSGALSFETAWLEFLELDGVPPTSVTPSGRGGGSQPEIGRLREEIRLLFRDAETYEQGFPNLEQNYRTTITRFKAQLERDRKAAGPDAADAHRRTAATSDQATQALERLHQRTVAIRSGYEERLAAAIKEGDSMELTCAKLAGAADAASTESCTQFSNEFSLLKARSEVVAKGFAGIEAVYQEVLQVTQQIAAEAAAAPAH